MTRSRRCRPGLALLMALLLTAVGCAVSQPGKQVPELGFLADYSRLHKGGEDQAELVYVRPGGHLALSGGGGSQPSRGEAAVEARITHAMTGQILAEGVDKRIGTRTLNAKSMKSWGDVENIMQYWVARSAFNICRAQERSNCQKPTH